MRVGVGGVYLQQVGVRARVGVRGEGCTCSRSLASVVHSGSISMEVSEAALGSASRIAAEVYLVGARVGVGVGARLRLRARARVRVRVRLRARVRDGVHPLKQPTSRHCYLPLLTTHYSLLTR